MFSSSSSSSSSSMRRITSKNCRARRPLCINIYNIYKGPRVVMVGQFPTIQIKCCSYEHRTGGWGVGVVGGGRRKRSPLPLNWRRAAANRNQRNNNKRNKTKHIKKQKKQINRTKKNKKPKPNLTKKTNSKIRIISPLPSPTIFQSIFFSFLSIFFWVNFEFLLVWTTPNKNKNRKRKQRFVFPLNFLRSMLGYNSLVHLLLLLLLLLVFAVCPKKAHRKEKKQNTNTKLHVFLLPPPPPPPQNCV